MLKQNEMRPLLTIIIPVYNVELYVQHCIESIKAQTFRGFEAIIVDDGSTDASVMVVKKYIESDNRFRLIIKKNGGVSSARNWGIKHAKNPFIAFLDADDLWDRNYLEVMSFLISCFPNSGIYGSGWRHLYGNSVCGGG